MTNIDTTETSLTVRRTFDASRERLFEAFTDPDDLEQWQPSDNFDVEVHTLEAEPGGELSLTHIHGDTRLSIEGTFEEVIENERLVHTWRVIDHPIDDSVSRIMVEFHDVEDGTEVVFTHENLDPEMVEDTSQGWSWILGRLEKVA